MRKDFINSLNDSMRFSRETLQEGIVYPCSKLSLGCFLSYNWPAEYEKSQYKNKYG